METLRIRCITWNVETTWPEQDLHQLVGLNATGQQKRPEPLPDIYIISLQEVRSQPQNVVMDALFEEPWTSSFREVLSEAGFVRVTGERLQGVVTSLFVPKKHLPHLRDIYSTVARTGFGGFWGNKGAVCIRFSLYGCSLCFVNSHLAPHDHGFDERLQNYNSIVDTAAFPAVPPTTNILYHDYAFWMGDLNFRLDESLSSEDIFQQIDKKALKSLYNHDELHKAQQMGEAFASLTEGAITFPPTYKYKEGTSEYDLARRPAWTDRVLHQVHVDAYENVKLSVEQTRYTSVASYTQSDHKPVVADYNIKVFAEYWDRCVTVTPIGNWRVGEGGTVLITFESDVETSPWDYVALFRDDLSSVHQYITYRYQPASESAAQRLADSLPSQVLSRSLAQPTKSATSGANSLMETKIEFNDELVQEAGNYLLLYYSEKYNCYLGMSESFPVLPRLRQI